MYNAISGGKQVGTDSRTYPVSYSSRTYPVSYSSRTYPVSYSCRTYPVGYSSRTYPVGYPFTAPSRKISGLKDAWTCPQSSKKNRFYSKSLFSPMPF